METYVPRNSWRDRRCDFLQWVPDLFRAVLPDPDHGNRRRRDDHAWYAANRRILMLELMAGTLWTQSALDHPCNWRRRGRERYGAGQAPCLALCVYLPARVDGWGVAGHVPPHRGIACKRLFAGLFAANMEQRKWKVPLYRFLYTLMTTFWLLFIRMFLVRRHR